jgi:hypothetical protein
LLPDAKSKAYSIALSDAFEKSVGRRIFIIVVNLN